MEKIRRVYNIDILKLLASFGVVVIHAGKEGFWDQVSFNCSQISVPLFFIITGFFYMSLSKEHLKRHIKKIIRIAIYATIYCFGVYVLIYKRDFYAEILPLTKITTWYSFIVFNEPLYGFHLWYLWSISYVLILLYFIPNSFLHKRKIIFFLILLLFILDSTVKIRVFIINALPFVLSGILLSFYKDYLKKLRYVSFVLCVFLFIYALDFYKIPFLDYKYFAIPVFILFYALPFKGVLASILAWLGKNCSLGIYIIHPLVLTLLKQNVKGLFPFFYALIAFSLLLVIVSFYKLLNKKYVCKDKKTDIPFC